MSQESPQRGKPGPVLRVLLPMLQWFWPRVGTPLHVRLYRLLGGRVVGGGSLLLTTVGRRSGKPRTVIVGYVRDGDDLIVGDTNSAKPAIPPWALNLRAHPEAEVQLGRERFQASAEFLEREDRAGQWDRLLAADPGYDWAQRMAGREISVIRLRKVEGSSV
ncbi:MAG: nitroreductase family deazaflavin-dependent oxidoreductase [SAR202 cluster bacterium]|nr:nitroreductase [Chloroflexota bacterium]MQG70002.1 nitroreductase family deazaflavin-dependent oxidoreductase [SAR202 cluster bacterium]HAL49034.1 nitroreductase family deazaflavin-dependent oxidoreductase [Dehalococcoidia bacterium]